MKFVNGEDKSQYNEVYKKLLDIGDIIGLEGTHFTTQVGQQTVKVSNFTLLNKSLRPLPLPKTDAEGNLYDAFNDPELRYRQRYVDLIVNPQVKNTFLQRSKYYNHYSRLFIRKRLFRSRNPYSSAHTGGVLQPAHL